MRKRPNEEILPKKIEGIPTADNALSERRTIVKKDYLKLCDTLAGNPIYNEDLGGEIFVRFRHGGKKATNNSVRHWQSTYAIKHLRDVLKWGLAVKDKNGSVKLFEAKRRGTQPSLGYRHILKLRYDFRSEKPYLNFTVEAIIGVIEDGKRYEYSVEFKQ